MKHITTYMNDQLQALYPPEEIRGFIRIILEKVCGLSNNQQILCKDKQIPENEKNRIYEIVDRLKMMEPLQYIFGETEFYSYRLAVNPSVMIPRPETEELVDMIIKSDYINARSKRLSFSILDVGTGSGCIIIALANHFRECFAEAVDISIPALELASRNSFQYDESILFKNIDILDTENFIKNSIYKFDLIVSNPPYIKKNEKAAMSANVLDYEPHQALFVPSTKPIIYYEAIADFALKKLKSGGMIFFEINPLCCKLIVNMLHKKGFTNTSVIRDLSGKERFITIIK